MRFHEGLYPIQAFRALGGRMTYEGGGKGGSEAPPAPNYSQQAAQQSESSKELATQQNMANRPNQQTPWGGTTWSTEATTDPSTGQQVTQYTQNLELNPQAQGALDSQLQLQQGRSDLAASTMPRVQADIAQPWDNTQFTQRQGGDMQTPQLDTSAPQQTTQTANEMGFVDERRRLEEASFSRMRPEHDYQNEALRTRLSNQGITEGSQAYTRAQQQQGDLQARERFNAISAGGEEQARMQAALLAQQQQAFSQDATSQQAQNAHLQSQQGADVTGANFTNNLRQQEIAEEAQRRGMSLNEMNALISGQQVQNPQMPGFVTASGGQAPQFLSAAQLEGQHGLDVYNTQQMGKQGMMSGLFGLGSSAVSLFG